MSDRIYTDKEILHALKVMDEQFSWDNYQDWVKKEVKFTNVSTGMLIALEYDDSVLKFVIEVQEYEEKGEHHYFEAQSFIKKMEEAGEEIAS